MNRQKNGPTVSCHVVAVPFPGRGHINPMMCLCEFLALRKHDLLVTFVVTEEWFGLVGSDPKPDNVRFAKIPNVIPSEVGRGADQPAFYEAVLRDMRAPLEDLLDRLQTPADVIVADTYLVWAADVGVRRNVPVASLWTSSATVYSVFHHFDLLLQNQHFPVDLKAMGHELVDYIPGLPPTRMADLPTCLYGKGNQILNKALESISATQTKAQYLLLASVYELEQEVIDALTKKLSHLPVYHIGPNIPYFKLDSSCNSFTCHFEWLDKQPGGSVLYVSQGSLFSTSKAQMEEIAAGLRDSGVKYFWVGREDCCRLREECGEKGMVVSWCDQLRVLCHPSVGGFWSHCGWNSTSEAAFAGVPMLTFPIYWDQVTNSKTVVEDWKMGWKVKRGLGDEEVLVGREEIEGIVRRFMDVEREEVREMRRRAGEMSGVCRRAVGNGGSSDAHIEAFLNDLYQNARNHA